MNKLNSKNPVQRFKQGKQIQKMQGGGNTAHERFVNWISNNIFSVKPTGGGLLGLINGTSSEPQQQKQQNPTKSQNSTKAKINSSSNKYAGSSVRDYSKKPQATQNVKPVTKPSVTKPTVKPKTTTVSPHFMKGYENVQPEIGGTENIKAMQQKMQSFYAPGTYKDDGIWGSNTQAAYEKYLQSLTPVKQETKPQSWFTSLTAQTIPSTTNFGYRTDNTYEGNDFSDRLKSMGIRSNADLIDFGWRTQGNNYDWKGDNWAKQFRSDINQALGGDWSDANIRKTFNIGGNWGRGFLGGGDISDFQRALQTNAGVWNGRYDQKRDNFMRSQPMQNLINNYFANGFVPYSDWRNNLAASKNFVFDRGNLFKAEKGGQLISNNPIERFKEDNIIKAQQGLSFKQAWNQARANKQRYFNWTDAKGVTRMYNSKSAGNDTDYESFIDNMNEMSALLPTDTQPRHLGWERNNPTSSELRGKDRQINKQGTESTLPEIIIMGQRRVAKKPTTSVKSGVNKNKASRNMSGTWGQGSGGGQQYANQRQYNFERSAFDKMRMKSAGIFGSTAYKTDSRGKRYVERDGNLYYDDGTYYSPQTRKTGKYTFKPGFFNNKFILQ